VKLLVRRINMENYGLSKEEIRKMVLKRVKVVYKDFGYDLPPYDSPLKHGSPKKGDIIAFVTALVAAVEGSLSDAIERNNIKLVEGLKHRGILKKGRVRKS
jgi:hypothetical protein